MKSHAKIEITAGALDHLRWNMEQLNALVENVIGPGKWDHTDTASIWLDALDQTIMVNIGGMTIGIEKDGYTHS